MSAPEILPAAADGLDLTRVTTSPVGGRDTVVETWSGPNAALATKKAALLAQSAAMTGLASCVLTEGSTGRGSLVASYEVSSLGNTTPGSEESIQQLNQIRVARDIFTAPYFEALTNPQIVAVRNCFEKSISLEEYDAAAKLAVFTDLQKKLYGHLTHGQDNYTALCYEFVKSWKTTSDKMLRKSCSSANTVQTAAALGFNSTTNKLVSDIETDAGQQFEWLKEPVELVYLGRGYWSITEKWIGLPKWSVIYGGSFTGLDAEA